MKTARTSPIARDRDSSRGRATGILLAGALVVPGILGVGAAAPAMAAPNAAAPHAAAPAAAPGAAVADGDYASLVNPFVGTESEGNAYPGATVPFGMVQLSPDNTNTYSSTSYSKDAKRVWGFSHQHINSAGCPAAGEVLVTPTTSAVPATTRAFIGLSDPDTTEKASAGYYTALLDNQVTAELTATTHVGEHRYTFPSGTPGNISFNVGETLNTAAESSVTWVDSSTLEGYVYSGGFCGGTSTTPFFFSAHFDRPAQSFGTWGTDGAFVAGSTGSTVTSGANGAAATFDTTTDSTVEVSVGVSFVDTEGARANRIAETETGADADAGTTGTTGTNAAAAPTQDTFDTIRARATDAWNTQLGRFDVTTKTADQLRVFYTQLYKSVISPTIGSDVDGRYRGMDQQVHTADGWIYYQRFSLWDTYRTLATLHALFEHDRATDIVRSMYQARVEGGWLPRWSLGSIETNVMAGDPVTPWLSENFALGTVPDDIRDQLWDYLIENATTTPPADVASLGRRSADYYLANGHVPYYPENGGGLGGQYEEYRHGGSATMEFALADASIGAAAQRTGRTADASTFLARGTNWQRLWNPDVQLSGGFTGIVNAVDPQGAFVSAPELAPVQESGFHEGTPWNYQWMAPQDVTGLTEKMGGRDAFLTRLDYYFDMPALKANPGVSPAHWASGGSDYYSSIGYNPGNEPMLGDAWLYSYVGEPAKTNDVLAANLNRFPDSPGGGVGNDDLGTLSSWYVLASLGMEPVQPGSGIMALNAPRVTSAAIALDNGSTVSIQAPDATGDAPAYVSGVTVDGQEHTKTWLDASDLQDGATVVFSLASDATGLTWGTAQKDWIPSVSDPAVSDIALSGAQGLTAVTGQEFSGTLATAAPGTPEVPIAASVSWDGGAATPATATLADGRWTISNATTFAAAGTHTATVTIAPTDVPAFAPDPFAPQTVQVAVVVTDAATGTPAPTDPAAPGTGGGSVPAGTGGTGNGTGHLAATGAGNTWPLAGLAGLGLLAGAALLLRRRLRLG